MLKPRKTWRGDRPKPEGAAYLDLAVRGGRRLVPAREVDQRIVAEQARALGPEELQDRDRHLADLDVGRRVAAHLDEVPQGPGVGGDEDLGLGGVGQDAPRRLARLLPPQ